MLNNCNFFFLRSKKIKFPVEQTLLYKHIEWDNIGETPYTGTVDYVVTELLTKLLGNY